MSRKEGDSRPLPFPTPYTQVLNDMRARLVRVSSDDPWLSADPEALEPLVRTGVHSMIVAPLLARDTVLGLLTLYRHRTDPFEEADLDVARQAAFTASVHLDNAHSYRREHTVAAALQRRLQPGAIPLLSAVETAHVYLPESAGGAGSTSSPSPARASRSSSVTSPATASRRRPRWGSCASPCAPSPCGTWRRTSC